mgnify:CR=1 FL=1
MLDIRFVRENPDVVKENIRKKFQDEKLPLVDEVVELDAKRRAAIAEVESLKAARNKLSKANGPLYGQLKKCADEAKKAELQAQIDQNNAAVKADDDRRAELDQQVAEMDYMAERKGVFVFNLGTGHGYSVLDMVHAFEKATGKKVPYKIAPRRAGDVAEVYCDPGKAERELGWKAEHSLEDMCRDSWNWQSKNPNGFAG